MGAAITAAADGAKMLKRGPSVILIGALAFLVALALTIALSWIPVVGNLLSNLLVLPLFLGGMIGACRGVATGEGAGKGFLSTLGDDWLSLIGAYGVVQVLAFGAGMVVMILIVLVGLVLTFVFAMGASSGSGGASTLGFGLFGGLLVIVYLAVPVAAFFFGMIAQFVDAAVVIDDQGPLGALTRSWELFKARPVSVFGYTLLRGLIGNLAVVGPAALIVVTVVGADRLGIGIDPTVALIVGGAVTLVIGPIAFTYQMAYHTAYFGRRTA